MGHAGEDCQPGPNKDGQTAQPDEALPRSDIVEPRTPPAPKRPLPPTHIHSLSSLVMPRPNSVAGTFTCKGACRGARYPFTEKQLNISYDIKMD